MRFRFWLEEITRIRLEDALREAKLEPVGILYLVPPRIDEKQSKEAEMKGPKLEEEKWGPSHLGEPAFFR